MKVTLAHRQYGLHAKIKEAEISGEFSDYATAKPEHTRDDFVIDEEKLLAALPFDFLPIPPGRVLLAVADDLGGTGQRGLTHFRNWAKYFDAYCLNLVKDARDAERGQG